MRSINARDLAHVFSPSDSEARLLTRDLRRAGLEFNAFQTCRFRRITRRDVGERAEGDSVNMTRFAFAVNSRGLDLSFVHFGGALHLAAAAFLPSLSSVCSDVPALNLLFNVLPAVKRHLRYVYCICMIIADWPSVSVSSGRARERGSLLVAIIYLHCTSCMRSPRPRRCSLNLRRERDPLLLPLLRLHLLSCLLFLSP